MVLRPAIVWGPGCGCPRVRVQLAVKPRAEC